MERTSNSSTMGHLYDSDINKTYILVGMVFLFGITWMDVFILTVYCRDWLKKKRLNTTDKILTLQGSIRIFLLSTTMTWYILATFHPWITQIGYLDKVITVNFWYSISCNVWLTASLCSYYCVKIADFSHPFFIHLKLRLLRLESTWLLGSAILSLGSSLPFVCSGLETEGNRNLPGFFQNKNVTNFSFTRLTFHMYVLLGFGYVAPFGICATSAALLLFSLWRHRQRMLGSWGGHRNPQINAHFQAVVTILSLLVNNVIAFISIQVLLSIDFEGNSISNLVASAVLYGCFSVESIISVWGNKKLKNELRRSSECFKCRGCVC